MRPTTVVAAATASDEPLDDLPPIDGDDEEADEPMAFDDLDERMLEDDSSDDSVADDLAVGELVAWLEEGVDAEDDAGDLDIGEQVVMFGDREAAGEDDDLQGAACDDMTLGIDSIPEQGAADAADESVMGGGEAEIDESQFPELDSDDAADLPWELRVDDTEIAEEVALPPWAAVRWQRVPIPLVAEPMACLWIGEDRVICGGQGALSLTFGPGAAITAEAMELDGLPSGEVIGVQGQAHESGWVLVATRHGVFLSEDGGKSVGAAAFRPPGEAAVAQVGASSRGCRACYARVTTGQVFASVHPDVTWKELEGLGLSRALTTDPNGNVGLLALRSAPMLFLFDERGECESEHVPTEASRELQASAAWLALGPGLKAFGDQARLWVCAPDTWESHALPRDICAAAVAATDSGPSLVVALHVEADDRAYLVQVTRDGSQEIVGDLSPDVALPSGAGEDEGDGFARVVAMAWDAWRSWLWVAGRFGLQAWKPVYPA